MKSYDELYGKGGDDGTAAALGTSLEQLDAVDHVVAPPPPSEEPPPGVPARTTWEPHDLAAALDVNPDGDAPTLLRRDDDIALLYAGRLNSIAGAPESAKSLLVQWECARRARRSEASLIIDFEDHPRAIAGRLLDLGLTRDELALVGYIRPHRPLRGQALRVFERALDDHKAGLVVVDGITAAMGNEGLDISDNNDVETFRKRLLEPLCATDAAVVAIDHLAKSANKANRYAIGAQHKLGAIDGAAFICETIRPFGRGRAGLVKVTLTKDRPGHLRQHEHHGTIAELTIRPDDEERQLELTLRAPAGDIQFRPTELMERVLRVIQAESDGLSKTDVRKGVKGRNEYIDLALERLLEENYIANRQSGAGHRYAHLRPYRQADDGDISEES